MLLQNRPWAVQPPLGTQIRSGHPLGQGIVGYWLCNEGGGLRAHDSSGYASHGILMSANADDWAAGKHGYALDFGGNNEYVDCGSASRLLVPNAKFYIAWIKWVPDGPGINHQLFCWDAGNARPSILLDLSGRPIVYMGNNNFQYYVSGTTTTLSNGNWHQVMIYIAGTGQNDIDNCEMWVDGREASKDGSPYKVGSPDPFDMFKISELVDTWQGLISNVSIYDRKLTATEIMWLYEKPFDMFIPKRFWINIPTAGAAKFASIFDTVGITDVLTNTRGLVVSLADTLGITDVLTKIGTYIRSIADPVGIADVLARAVGKVIVLADTVGTTDTLAAIVFKLVQLTDTVGITDTLSIVGTYIRAITDTVGITDALGRVTSFVRTIADTIGITDVMTGVLPGVAKFAAIVDTVGITDAMSRVHGVAVSLADTVGIADTISRVGTYIRTILDTVGIADVLQRTASYIRLIADTVGITDVLSAFIGLRFRESQQGDSAINILDSGVSTVNPSDSGDSDINISDQGDSEIGE